MAQKGIKETKEVLVAVNAVAVLIIERLRDGVGIDDAVVIASRLTSDPVFVQKLSAAYDKIGDVPEEIKDLDIPEVVEIITTQAMELPKLIQAIHGKAA